MARRAALLAGALSLIGGVALWASRRLEQSHGASGGLEGPLSRRRVLALASVAEVVPATYPDARFKLMAPSYAPEDPAWRARLQAAGVNPDHYTTCGELPRYVGGKIGVNTRGGLASIRDLGMSNGAWVKATGKNRPKPGDFYLLAKDPAGKEIVHTGVIGHATGTIWQTADAGQGAHGTPQQTAYVTRVYDPSAVTLGGRSLIGWYDIDKGSEAAA